MTPKRGRPFLDKSVRRQRLTVLLKPETVAKIVAYRKEKGMTNNGRALDELLKP